MRQPVLVIAALAVAAALTACGGGSGGALSLDPVAQAAEKTMHSSGEKISITGDFDVSGRSLHMFGGGVSNSSSADLTVVVDAFSQNHLTLREIYVTEAGNPVVYLSSPQSKGQIPHGKKWARIDIGKALKQRYGMNVGQMPGANQNPTQFVQLLRTSGLEPKKVGEETIAGTPATHYHVVIDAEKAAKASGASAAGIRALRGQAGST